MEKNCYMELDLARSGDVMIIVERNTFSKTANKPKENMTDWESKMKFMMHQNIIKSASKKDVADAKNKCNKKFFM